jgi:uncharacterized protein (TIGR00266 family)
MVYIPQPYVTGQGQQQQSQNNNNRTPQINSYAPRNAYAAATPVTNAYAPSVYAPSQTPAPAPAPSAYAPAPNAYAPSVYAPSQTPAPAPSAYAAATPVPNAYAPSVYAPAQTKAPAPAPSAYAPASTYNPYAAYAAPQQSAPPAYAAPITHSAPAPSAPSAYNAYASASAPSAYKASAPARDPSPSRMPDFSQCLDLPPPPRQEPPRPTRGQYDENPYSKPSAPPSAYAVAVPTNHTVGASAVSSIHSGTYTGGPTGGLVNEGNPVTCHKVDYEIKGHEMQLVEIELDPSETIIAEAGAMMFLDDGIEFKTKFGDGSTPKEGFFKKVMSAGGRLLTGESLFLTHFSNTGSTPARVAFAAPYPGSILPINLANLGGGKLICQKDAFLCAAFGTKLSIHFNKKIGAGLFGGEGFILQKLTGDGMAFIHAGGTVIKRELRGERLRLDTGCLVAYTEGINFDIQFVPGLKSMIFGGEGLFLATLQGTGTVWMQSLPFSRMADRIIQAAPSAGGSRQGEGSALTGRFGDLLNGDGF